MELYTQKPQPKIERKRTKQEYNDYDNGDFEDDMKLFDLKRKLEVTFEISKACRACADMEARVNIFEHKDDDGTDLASKLKLVGGIEVRTLIYFIYLLFTVISLRFRWPIVISTFVDIDSYLLATKTCEVTCVGVVSVHSSPLRYIIFPI